MSHAFVRHNVTDADAGAALNRNLGFNSEALLRARAEGDSALNSPRLADRLARDVDEIDAERLLRYANESLSSPRAAAHDAPGAAETPQRTDAPAEGITCPTCFGDGYVMAPAPHATTCPECNGTGLVVHLGDLDIRRNPPRERAVPAAHNGTEGELLSEGAPPALPPACSCDPFKEAWAKGYRVHGWLVCARCHGRIGARPPLAPITTPVSRLSPETLKFWANPPR